MPQHPAVFDQLVHHLRQAALLESVGSLLSWDQETYMPPAAAEHRSEQAAILSTLTHERMTSPKLGELLAACESDASLSGDPISPAARNLREIRRDFDRDTRLPIELVAELAKVGSQAQEVWKEARAKSDFAMFRPWLERMMTLTRRKAECLRTPAHGELYDALLDTYEPGASAVEIDTVFSPLAERLSALVRDLGQAGRHPAASVLNVPFDHERQHAMATLVLKSMGFDFESGRLDVTTHPFCSGMAPGDTRLTTRYKDQTWTNSLYSSMHEGGHGLYEQGLPKLGPAAGTPLSQAISLGIHESQSRMWENFVGRSREFWSWLMPHAKTFAGGSLDAFTADDAYRAVNQAKPSFIRVDADEATYNLHVLIRFRLERAIMSGDLPINDIPGEWNAAYKKYLGIDVPSDKLGCLQDVHWSFGLIGYFPTYTLGNLYAAQLWETINAQIPNLPSLISRGEFGELKAWLNTNIHAHGRRYLASELCQKLTGKPLSADPLMRYLEGKLRAIYGE